MAWINQQAGVIRAPPLPRRERPHTSLIRALAEGKRRKKGRESKKKENKEREPAYKPRPTQNAEHRRLAGVLK